MNIYIIFVLIFICHIAFAWRTQLMINRSIVFNSFQKQFNSILSWVIPFLWSFIVRSVLKERNNSVNTKTRRRKSKGNNSDNWENLTGYGGGSGID